MGVAAEHRVDLGQVAVALFPHGKGQAALADLPVAAALVGDGVEIPLHRQVAGADQFGHRLGKVKVLHPVVAEGEVRQGGEVHRSGHPRHQVEDEKLDVQFVVNEPYGLPSRSAPGGVAGPIIASLRGKDKGFFSREAGGWARKGVLFETRDWPSARPYHTPKKALFQHIFENISYGTNPLKTYTFLYCGGDRERSTPTPARPHKKIKGGKHT